MAYIRTLIFYIALILVVLFCFLGALLIYYFVDDKTFYNYCTFWLKVIRKLTSLIIGIKFNVTGLENLPKNTDKAVVVLIKHQTDLETFIIPSYFNNRFAYVFKKELFLIPGLGWVLKRLDMLPIDRKQRSLAFNFIQEKGTQLLSQGVWVAIYPEGTRTARGKRGKYKIGGAALAVNAQVDVVPVASSFAKGWGEKTWCKKPGVIDISFGTPISSQELNAEQLLAKVEDWIENEMLRLDPQAYQQVDSETKL